VANGWSNIPEWLTAGVTYLIPKNENTGNPKNYIYYKQTHAEIYG
jgi:hypothetical protein